LGDKIPENERIQEKINAYQYIIDSAYMLFEGKYSVKDIETMPYKILLRKIENEQKLTRELNEEKQRREEEEMRELKILQEKEQRHMIAEQRRMGRR
jgi:hypothetical protein